jgi:hypothetical protein
MFSSWKDEMSKKDKATCWEAIKEAQDHLNEAFDELRSVQNEEHENRIQKQREWRERTESRIRENYAKLEKAQNALERVESNISKLEDNISNAWNDDYIDRAEVWLSEAESQKSDIEAWIEKLERWIQEDEDKL